MNASSVHKKHEHGSCGMCTQSDWVQRLESSTCMPRAGTRAHTHTRIQTHTHTHTYLLANAHYAGLAYKQ